jgi:hypothetical protein
MILRLRNVGTECFSNIDGAQLPDCSLICTDNPYRCRHFSSGRSLRSVTDKSRYGFRIASHTFSFSNFSTWLENLLST